LGILSGILKAKKGIKRPCQAIVTEGLNMKNDPDNTNKDCYK